MASPLECILLVVTVTRRCYSGLQPSWRRPGRGVQESHRFQFLTRIPSRKREYCKDMQRETACEIHALSNEVFIWKLYSGFPKQIIIWFILRGCRENSAIPLNSIFQRAPLPCVRNNSACLLLSTMRGARHFPRAWHSTLCTVIAQVPPGRKQPPPVYACLSGMTMSLSLQKPLKQVPERPANIHEIHISDTSLRLFPRTFCTSGNSQAFPFKQIKTATNE